MIGFLKGTIQSKAENFVVVGVNGVGYEVFLAKSSLAMLGAVGSSAELEIHTHFTESHLQLYGFLSADEKMLFKKLISVSGIGPKMGLSIVSAYPFELLINAIVQGDLTALTNISGIGKKTAERIVIELKDKFKTLNLTRSHPIERVSYGDHRHNDALQALVSLGYSENLARRALEKISVVENDTVQNIIKRSLGAMSS